MDTAPPASVPRRSLRTRWTLLLVAFGLAPVVALALLTVRIQRSGLARAEKELEVAIVDQVSEIVEGELTRTADVTRRVGQVLGDGRIESDDVRLELAREALAQNAMVDVVAVYGSDGKLIDAIRRDGTGNAPVPPQLDVGGLAAPGVSPVGSLPGEVQWVEPIGKIEDKRGWVLGHLQPGTLDAAVRDLSQVRFGVPGRIAVVDDKLRVVAGGDRGASLAGKDIFSAVQMSESALATTFVLTAEFLAADGERMVGTVRTLPARGMVVVVRRPEAEAFLALAASRRAFYVAAVLVSLIALGLGRWSATRTTRPIEALVRLTKAYGRREFKMRSTVTTGDEIETLGNSLTRMADNIAASEVEIARRAAVEADLSRFLPEDLAKRIAAGEADLTLGGQRRRVSIVFADVASFTTFAETAPPERVVAFLNELLTVLTEVTFRHGGMVDKFIGDSIMAVFGATGDAASGDAEHADHAAAAVAAAEDMHRFVEASAPAWQTSFGMDAKLGIGVATGEVVLGNLGSDKRMEFTAIGDAVNVAARLEALARPGQTLLTEEAATAAGDAFEFGEIGEKPLRGKRNAVKVLELLS